MTSEVIEGEVLEPGENGTRAMVPSDAMVSLPVSVEAAVQQWNDYQELTRRLLNDTDYQRIGKSQFKKKSAWRKYARAFNITDRVTHEEIHRDTDGFPLWARVRVEAYHAPTDRRTEADHECHVTERCCPERTGLPCRQKSYQSHTCCKRECDGRLHFSHPGDLPATALTRAKNRAISDIIGAGEVSAEEMDSGGSYAAPRTPRQPAAGNIRNDVLALTKRLATETDAAFRSTVDTEMHERWPNLVSASGAISLGSAPETDCEAMAAYLRSALDGAPTP